MDELLQSGEGGIFFGVTISTETLRDFNTAFARFNLSQNQLWQL